MAVLGCDGFLPRVRAASTRLLAITDGERGRLVALGPSFPLVEGVALGMFRQIVVVARAQALLGEARCLPPDAHNPATALARLMSEGLVYLNYLLAEDSEWRSRMFFMHDEMQRERFLSVCSGKRWPRHHGRPENRRPNVPASRTLSFNVVCDPARVDTYEAEWIAHNVDLLADSFPTATRGLVPPSGTKYDSVADMRQWWNGLGECVKHGPAIDLWKNTCHRWNQLPRWPFGLTPKDAATEGHLTERIRKIAHDEGPDATEISAVIGEWTYLVGLDLGSDWTHFSTARVFLGGPGYTDPAWVSAHLALALAARLLEPHYAWATEAKEAVG